MASSQRTNKSGNDDFDPSLKHMLGHVAAGGPERQNRPVARIKAMAYTLNRNPVSAGRVFRMERGFPFQRRGNIVVATPQFRSLTLYSFNSAASQVRSTTSTPVAIFYPAQP